MRNHTEIDEKIKAAREKFSNDTHLILPSGKSIPLIEKANSQLEIKWMGEELGCGVFSTGHIKKGDVIGCYSGRLVEESMDGRYACFVRVYEENAPRGAAMKMAIDGQEGGILGLIQHAPTRKNLLKTYKVDPTIAMIVASANASIKTRPIKFDGKIVEVPCLVANQDIPSGVMLSFDYTNKYWDGLDEEPALLTVAGQSLAKEQYQRTTVRIQPLIDGDEQPVVELSLEHITMAQKKGGSIVFEFESTDGDQLGQYYVTTQAILKAIPNSRRLVKLPVYPVGDIYQAAIKLKEDAVAQFEEKAYGRALEGFNAVMEKLRQLPPWDEVDLDADTLKAIKTLHCESLRYSTLCLFELRALNKAYAYYKEAKSQQKKYGVTLYEPDIESCQPDFARMQVENDGKTRCQVSEEAVKSGWQQAINAGGMEASEGQRLFNISARAYFQIPGMTLETCSMAAYSMAKQLENPGSDKASIHKLLTDFISDGDYSGLAGFKLEVDEVENVAAAYFAALSLSQLSVAPESIDSLYFEEKRHFTPLAEIKAQMMALLMRVGVENTSGLHKFYSTHAKDKRILEETKPWILRALSQTQVSNKARYDNMIEKQVQDMDPTFPQLRENLNQFSIFLSEHQVQHTADTAPASVVKR